MKKLLLLLGMLSLTNLSSGQVALANEGFESATFPPTGWVVDTQTADPAATATWFQILNADYVISGAATAGVNYSIVDVQDESLISPAFSLVGYTHAYFNFTVSVGYEYMVDPNANGNLFAKVSINGGTTWTQVWVEEDEGEFDDYAFISKSIDLTPYVGNANVKVKFEYEGFDADLARVDDVSVTGCAGVSDVALTALGDTTASATWIGTSASYDVEYGPIDFVNGTGTLANTTTAAYNFTALTPGMGYDFYVRSNCGGTAVGGWSGPYTFYTNLTAPSSLDYAYGFEGATLGSVGWSRSATSGNAWAQYIGDDADPTQVQEGEHFAGAVGSTTAATNAYLYSRGLNLVGGSTVTIKFYVRKFDFADIPGSNNLVVKIGTAATPAGQTTVLGTYNELANDVYEQKTLTYAVPTTGVYYIGFNATSPIQSADDQGAILLDNVTVAAPLSVGDVFASKFDVYPNPAKNLISITNSENILVNNVSLTDLNGRVVKQINFSNVANAQINVSDLASGMYMMNINTDQGSAVKKIMKN